MSEFRQGISKGTEAHVSMAFKMVRTKSPEEDEKEAEGKSITFWLRERLWNDMLKDRRYPVGCGELSEFKSESDFSVSVRWVFVLGGLVGGRMK